MKNSLIFALVTVAATSLQAASFEDHARVLDVQERYSGNSSNSGTRTVCEPVQQTPSNEYGAGTAIGAWLAVLLAVRSGKAMDVSQELPSALQQAQWPGTMLKAETANRSNVLQTSEGYGNGYNNAGQRRATGYTVTYEYAGRTFTEYRNRPPTGDTIKVRVNVVPN
jgi:hypothetical protein